jgi:aminoglycoside 6'-N-acetyltransferase
LEDTSGVYAIDLFIGETEYWNQGIGSRVISKLVDYLFNELNVQKVVVDPETWNTRAIHCYEKCGFVKVKLLPKHELHEGEYRDCWLMAINRDK